MQKKPSKPAAASKSGRKAYQKSSGLNKVLKDFLVSAKLVKDGNETDTQTSGGDKQSDD